jgi:hypothetical protein
LLGVQMSAIMLLTLQSHRHPYFWHHVKLWWGRTVTWNSLQQGKRLVELLRDQSSITSLTLFTINERYHTRLLLSVVACRPNQFKGRSFRAILLNDPAVQKI